MDKEKICKLFREILLEFGSNALLTAVLITPYDDIKNVSNIPCICCPTLDSERLANVAYKVAKYFEDAQ